MYPDRLKIENLGRMGYQPAYEKQAHRLEEVLAARDAGAPLVGTCLFVEHDPVITISRRPTARAHLLASPEALAQAGVGVEETDRGGDITYHGPGQLVAYLILDLNYLRLRLHEHMRMLEGAVIDACAHFGVDARRDEAATGVWVDHEGHAAKICAMGVRVRRWVSMHGLALNVAPNLDHFDLIVPCGLAGRGVTSLARILGDAAPTMAQVREALAHRLQARLATTARA